jgi:hypothetical protein
MTAIGVWGGVGGERGVNRTPSASTPVKRNCPPE